MYGVHVRHRWAIHEQMGAEGGGIVSENGRGLSFGAHGGDITNTTPQQVAEIIARPFDSNDIEWRLMRSGVSSGKKWALCVPYITARAAHSRLDEAFGPFNWRNEFRVMEIAGGTSGIVCRLWYRHPEITGSAWEWKENGASQTQIEPFKGGLSDAEKRAFEQLGGGRYLYSLEESFAEISDKRSENTPNWAKMPEKSGGDPFYWGPPCLPDWAIPRVKQAVIEASKTLLGTEIQLPTDYASFEALCDQNKGRTGINDLRMVGVIAKQHNWAADKLVLWIAEHGVDLSAGANAEDFKRLRDAIAVEVGSE